MLNREECHSQMDQNNIEMIGKIKLDLSHYLGEDIYSDGDIEDELLRIARDRSEVEFQQIIVERKSWPILYHLSALRENIVEWLPITSDMKHFPSESAARAVPHEASVACSTAKALEWDEAWKNMNDPSGRAVSGVHEQAYE